MTKDPLSLALTGPATEARSAFHVDARMLKFGIVNHPMSKAVIPQIQEQPQMGTETESS